ncbi:integrase catalytic domain-containing protein [Trichonephila clavata]|uniref:Integrase catalytic domain-containing protein n=1 Tax=Trichonephila clavata TaxID=2740835 RepID=A0A8X6LJ22_TRICU|nr:integrase catalytic domain-containing protein [Trichonephila clavata]
MRVQLFRNVESRAYAQKFLEIGEGYLEPYQEEEDIIERIEPFNENDNEPFLPQRPVLKDNSTTKVRPVFDGSARQRNCPSLNDCLEKGSNLIELIPSLINKFRFGKFGLISDIEKAFLQIEIQASDRKYLKFLRWEHGQREKLKCFQHKRVVFGILSSPFLLGATIEFHLSNAPHLQEELLVN